jgi:hypothetical protein
MAQSVSGTVSSDIEIPSDLAQQGLIDKRTSLCLRLRCSKLLRRSPLQDGTIVVLDGWLMDRRLGVAHAERALAAI